MISEDHRERMNYHAIDAFVAVAQSHSVVIDNLPKCITQNALALVEAALKYNYSRPTGTYAMAMLLNFGTSKQVRTFTNWIPAEPFRKLLFDTGHDLEKNSVEEELVDLHIYSTLILSKYPPAEPDVGEVKALIGRMGKAIEKMDTAIGDTVIGDSGPSGVEAGPDVSRVGWKAIYLSALLFALVPEAEKGELPKKLETKARALVQNGGPHLPADYEHCLQPLGMRALKSRTPAEQRGPENKVFERWVDEFPLLSLPGSVTKAPARVR